MGHWKILDAYVQRGYNDVTCDKTSVLLEATSRDVDAELLATYSVHWMSM